MGMMTKKLLFMVSFIALNASSAALEVATERRQVDWPRQNDCLNCVPLQFGELMMRVPLDRIEKVVVLGSDQSGVHLVPRGSGKSLITFLTVPRADLVGRYERANLLETSTAIGNRALLDRLFAVPTDNDRQLVLIRRFEEIDKASMLIRSSRGGLHLFWIRHRRPSIDKAYVTVDGSEVTYMVSGEITDELMEELLSNMRREPLP